MSHPPPESTTAQQPLAPRTARSMKEIDLAMKHGRSRKAARAATAWALAALATGPSGALAQAASDASQTDEIAHTVQDGDTLEGLARIYLAAPHQWPLLQARNKVANPRRLRPGSVVWIPVRLQPPESATVEFVEGHATQRPRGGSVSTPLAPGGRLEEGSLLQVGPEAFVSVKLADGTVVRVQAGSELNLRQLRRRGRAGSLQSVLEMRSGAVESTVPPNAESFRRFELRTPQAVTSVRGTRFSVAMDDAGQTVASVLNGSVAVQGREHTAQPGQDVTALLAPGQGLAVAANGTVGVPQPLLSAPDTAGVPATLGDAGLLAIDVPEVPGAVRYEAQIARDALGTQVLRQGRFADGHLRWKALDDGNYYLSVRALDGAGIPGLPAVRPFAIKTRPAPPLYQHPAPGGVVARGTGELQCTQVPGVPWYRIQVASDAQFTQPALDMQQLSDCRVALTTLPVGQYFWRAASQQPAAGAAPIDQGPFAPPQPFAVADRPAGVPLQSLAVQDARTTVRLHWPAQPGQRFRLQLAAATDPAFDQVLQDGVLDTPEWTATQLQAGSYLVRIQVLEPTGLQSDFSPPRQIRVNAGVRTGSGLPVSTSHGLPVGGP